MRRSLILFLCLSALAALGVQAQLALSITPDKSTLVAGNFVTYTITVTNTDTNPASNVKVTLLLPIFSSVNFLGPGCAGDNTVTCTAPSLAGGAGTSFTVSIRHNQTGVVTTKATVVPSSTPPASVDVKVTPRMADLVLTASALSGSVPPGGTVTYRMNIVSRGPDSLWNVLTAAYFPDFVQAKSVPLDCADSHSAVQCLVGTLSPHAPIPYVFTVKAPTKPGPFTVDFALVTTDVDTDLSNNSASVTVNVTNPTPPGPNDANLAVALDYAPGTTPYEATFTTKIVNLGPAIAKNALIEFVAPDDVMIVDISSPYIMTCSTGLSGAACSFPALGTSVTVPVSIKVREVNKMPLFGEFLARVKATNPDPDPSNNTTILVLRNP
jgi:uncharacterized repeat protein (TIGR01451 family)